MSTSEQRADRGSQQPAASQRAWPSQAILGVPRAEIDTERNQIEPKLRNPLCPSLTLYYRGVALFPHTLTVSRDESIGVKQFCFPSPSYFPSHHPAPLLPSLLAARYTHPTSSASSLPFIHCTRLSTDIDINQNGALSSLSTRYDGGRYHAFLRRLDRWRSLCIHCLD